MLEDIKEFLAKKPAKNIDIMVRVCLALSAHCCGWRPLSSFVYRQRSPAINECLVAATQERFSDEIDKVESGGEDFMDDYVAKVASFDRATKLWSLKAGGAPTAAAPAAATKAAKSTDDAKKVEKKSSSSSSSSSSSAAAASAAAATSVAAASASGGGEHAALKSKIVKFVVSKKGKATNANLMDEFEAESEELGDDKFMEIVEQVAVYDSASRGWFPKPADAPSASTAAAKPAAAAAATIGITKVSSLPAKNDTAAAAAPAATTPSKTHSTPAKNDAPAAAAAAATAGGADAHAQLKQQIAKFVASKKGKASNMNLMDEFEKDVDRIGDDEFMDIVATVAVYDSASRGWFPKPADAPSASSTTTTTTSAGSKIGAKKADDADKPSKTKSTTVAAADDPHAQLKQEIAKFVASKKGKASNMNLMDEFERDVDRIGDDDFMDIVATVAVYDSASRAW